MEVSLLESYATCNLQVLLPETWGPLLGGGSGNDGCRTSGESQPRSQRFEPRSAASCLSSGQVSLAPRSLSHPRGSHAHVTSTFSSLLLGAHRQGFGPPAL